MSRDDERLQFETDDARFSTRLPEGKFPNYEAVLTGVAELSKKARIVLIDSKELLFGIKRAQVTEDDRSHCIYLTLGSDHLVVGGTAGDTSKVAAVVVGAPIKMGVCSNYLADCVKACGSPKVRVTLTDSFIAIKVEPENQRPDLLIRTFVMSNEDLKLYVATNREARRQDYPESGTRRRRVPRQREPLASVDIHRWHSVRARSQ